MTQHNPSALLHAPARTLTGLPSGTVLESLAGLLTQSDLSISWTGVIARLVEHRSRLAALAELDKAASARQLAVGLSRSDGRLAPARAVIGAELTAQSYLWGHIAEEVLDRVVCENPPSGTSALLDCEAQPPWVAPSEMQAPTLRVRMAHDEIPPLLFAAMERLEVIEQARRRRADWFECAHEPGTCEEEFHIAEGESEKFQILTATIAEFREAVVAFGDAVAYTLTRELRPALVRPVADVTG